MNFDISEEILPLPGKRASDLAFYITEIMDTLFKLLAQPLSANFLNINIH